MPVGDKVHSLTVLERLNRKLRTGLWQIPPQWLPLRRVPPFHYYKQAIPSVRVPQESFYNAIYERFPMLRMEKNKSPVLQQGQKSLTYRIAKSLHASRARGVSKGDSWLVVQEQFSSELAAFEASVARAYTEAKTRHEALVKCKEKKDKDIYKDINRDPKYSLFLEHHLNRHLNIASHEYKQFFSLSSSNTLLPLYQKYKTRALTIEKVRAIEHEFATRSPFTKKLPLDTSDELKQLSLKGSTNHTHDPFIKAIPGALALQQPSTTQVIQKAFPEFLLKDKQKPSFANEPRPSLDVMAFSEYRWLTGFQKGDTWIGHVKDQAVHEMYRHLDNMIVEPDATIADYIAYVLYQQITVMKSMRLIQWPPYTNYITPRMYEYARQLFTYNRRSYDSNVFVESNELFSLHQQNQQQIKETAAQRTEALEKVQLFPVSTKRATPSPLSPDDPASDDALPASSVFSDADSLLPKSLFAPLVDPIQNKSDAKSSSSASITSSEKPTAFEGHDATFPFKGAQTLKRLDHVSSQQLKQQQIPPNENTLSCLLPKVRSYNTQPFTFQQMLLHSRLHTIIEAGLKEPRYKPILHRVGAAKQSAQEVKFDPHNAYPNTPFWQSVEDERVRYLHPGEGYYNRMIKAQRLKDNKDFDKLRRNWLDYGILPPNMNEVQLQRFKEECQQVEQQIQQQSQQQTTVDPKSLGQW